MLGAKVKTYQLSDGLQETLKAWMDAYLKDHTDQMAQEVDSGTIGETTLTAFVAWGVIPSKRDPRLTLVSPEE